MIKLSDCCPVRPFSADENAWRGKRYSVCIAKIGPDARVIRAHGCRTALEYLQPTYRDKFNLLLTRDLPGETYVDLADPGVRAELVRRCAAYVTEHHLDGLFLDTPLEHPDPMAAARFVADLRNGLGLEKVVLPNFGGYGDWAKPKPGAWQSMFLVTDWHFVQVGLRLHETTTVPEIEARLLHLRYRIESAGKRIVFGIDDRPMSALSSKGPHAPALAARIMRGFDHPRLWWYYQRDAQPEVGTHAKDYCWNSEVEG